MILGAKQGQAVLVCGWGTSEDSFIASVSADCASVGGTVPFNSALKPVAAVVGDTMLCAK